MIVFPNAKINLGLNIHSKRNDGYHNIESCFYPIEVCDILEILPSENLTFTSSGLEIPGEDQDNLCLKAYKLLKADFDISPVQIHLHKIIPMGAGLGGGSSDATFTLKIINELFHLNLSDSDLESYAAKLGSDCPFFVRNKPIIATGRGTEFKPVDLDLSKYNIELKYPGIHIGTKEAYASITPKIPSNTIREIIGDSVSYWRDNLKNDFEDSIFQNYPQIKKVKEEFYNNGAIYASMTGSGSAVYGLFKK